MPIPVRSHSLRQRGQVGERHTLTHRQDNKNESPLVQTAYANPKSSETVTSRTNDLNIGESVEGGGALELQQSLSSLPPLTQRSIHASMAPPNRTKATSTLRQPPTIQRHIDDAEKRHIRSASAESSLTPLRGFPPTSRLPSGEIADNNPRSKIASRINNDSVALRPSASADHPKLLNLTAHQRQTSEVRRLRGGLQFTTHQQRYSAKKIGASPSSGSAAQSEAPPENRVSLPHGLRDELLQLSLIHGPSLRQSLHLREQKEKQIAASRFAALQGKNQLLVRRESKLKSKGNLKALQAWREEDGVYSESEKIQLLAQCIQDVSDIVAEGGTYSSALAKFEAWHNSTVLELDRRNAQKRSSISFITPVGQDWTSKVLFLQRKLEYCTRMLDSLGSPISGSGIEFVLHHHRHYARNLLLEVRSWMEIETLARAQEYAWIEEMAFGVVVGLNGAPRGSWQAPNR